MYDILITNRVCTAQIAQVDDKRAAIRYCRSHNSKRKPGIKYTYRKTPERRDGPQPEDPRDIPEECRTCIFSDSLPECDECQECGEYDRYQNRRNRDN